MLEVGNKDVVLQARNLPLSGNGATVIKAVGICVANADTIHVAVVPTGGLDVWVKVNLASSPQWQQVLFSPSNTLPFNGVIDETESCFYYGPGESHGGFTNLFFVPSFGPPTNPNVPQADIDALCGSNEFCAFDYLATEDATFAGRTLAYFEQMDMISAATTGFDTCSPLTNPTNGIVLIASGLVGGTATYQCFQGFLISEEVTRICQGDFQWSGSAPTCTADPNFSCIIKRPFVGAKEDKDVFIYALPSSTFNPSDVCFVRSFDTGAGKSLPPSKVSNVNIVSNGKVLSIPLSDKRQGRRFGVFACVAQIDGCDEKVEVRAVVTADRKGLIPTDGRITRTVSVGDKVKIAVTRPNKAPQRTRWLKNGNHIPNWNGRNYVILKDVTLKDQGIYEVFRRGRRLLNQHTMIILYIRACPKGSFGIGCFGICSCQNGGLCDELSGKCTCPPGFFGTSCESGKYM
ncbi:Tyrosine-protein kinase receptor Tie-1 [Holothuria leucospilota]|uniref:Tyrosine-protein kinase receptor Tie-1 n=1 Tax=Holothuria leucospilota TaxID=206669 RepID=A0A9Q1CNM4_HOLLE|nr:Tyrosine-protein kinase receptor Tie-1 [Holothuria leucospilota]